MTADAGLLALESHLAEYVMGWKRWDMKDDWRGPKGQTFFTAPESGYRFVSVYDGGSENPTRHLAFTASITDAWVLVEHVMGQGWKWTLETPFEDVTSFFVELRSGKTEDSQERYRVECRGETMPLAICLAALEWKVREELAEFYPSKYDAERWLYAPQKLLGGDTPMQRLEDFEADTVFALLDQIRTGAFV